MLRWAGVGDAGGDAAPHMSRLLCCLRARRHDMGAALSHHQEGECDGTAEPVAPPTMADVIRERKKKAGGAALGTLRRRLVAAARRPRDARPDREEGRRCGFRHVEASPGRRRQEAAGRAPRQRSVQSRYLLIYKHMYVYYCKKKAGGAALGTLKRRLVAAARKPRDARPDRGRRCGFRHVEASPGRRRQEAAGRAPRQRHVEASPGRRRREAAGRAPLQRSVQSRYLLIYKHMYVYYCKKKASGAALGTLRRRLVAAARRPRYARPDRGLVANGIKDEKKETSNNTWLVGGVFGMAGCEHARFIRSVVSSWRLAEVFVLCEQLEAGAALRDLLVQAELAREPAPALHADLLAALRDRWWCDVELVGAGWSLAAHRAILAARCSYFRELLQRYPNGCRVPLEGVGASLSKEELQASVRALYAGPAARRAACDLCSKWERNAKVESDLDIISGENTASRRSCACGRTRSDARSLRRLGEILGFSIDMLHRDMKYLLESGEQSDARLVFRLEGGGAAYGFRTALELPCHRLVLAARSRFFR
ncbi:unnamed protein product, partial [Parnassius apollo]